MVFGSITFCSFKAKTANEISLQDRASVYLELASVYLANNLQVSRDLA
jgi:hypothetical protein